MKQDPTPRVPTARVLEHWLEDTNRLDGRQQFMGLIQEAAEQPFEIWVNFARNVDTGQIGIRKRYIKMIRADRDRSFAIVADASDGIWTGITFFRGRRGALTNLRNGHLVWGRQ